MEYLEQCVYINVLRLFLTSLFWIQNLWCLGLILDFEFRNYCDPCHILSQGQYMMLRIEPGMGLQGKCPTFRLFLNIEFQLSLNIEFSTKNIPFFASCEILLKSHIYFHRIYERVSFSLIFWRRLFLLWSFDKTHPYTHLGLDSYSRMGSYYFFNILLAIDLLGYLLPLFSVMGGCMFVNICMFFLDSLT